MEFTGPKFERLESEEQDRKEGEQKLERFLGEIGEKLRKEGLPIDNDCRINMEAFSGVYSKKEIEKDQETVVDYKEEWREKSEKETFKKDGEKLEALKTAIFHKFLGKEFVIARTSVFDDIKNKIDNIILEKETGNLVCAFDEVSDMAGAEYEKKKTKVLERDVKEKGGKLKYGLKFEEDENHQMKLILGEAAQIPIFYLALDKKYINEGIKNLTPSFEEKSQYEKKLWEYFIASLNAQVQYLSLERRLEPALKNRLELFKKTIQE